ncbi:unnamed protein product [Closterium sp. NIES-65]|nr:unnamed protein product [Closterium sp. NIES-65]
MQRVSEIELLTDDERRALRASRFSAERLPSPPRSSHSASAAAARQAHPGGPLATNKAAALSRFLQRRLAASGEGSKGGERGALDPRLVEVAVRNAQATLVAAASSGGGAVRHVDCFDEGDQGGGATDSSGSLSGFDEPQPKVKQRKRKGNGGGTKGKDKKMKGNFLEKRKFKKNKRHTKKGRAKG